MHAEGRRSTLRKVVLASGIPGFAPQNAGFFARVEHRRPDAVAMRWNFTG